MKIREIKALRAMYVGNETFIIDSTRGYDFGVKKENKYVILNEADYDLTRKFMEKVCKPENYEVLEALGII